MIVSLLIMLLLILCAKFGTNEVKEQPEMEASTQLSAESDYIDLSELTAGAGNGDAVKAYVMPTEEAQEDSNGEFCISIEKAASIGLNEAEKYYPEMKLVNIYSYPDDVYPDIDGEDGKRSWWFVDCANEKNNFVSILIYNSKILDVEQWNSRENNGTFELDDMGISIEQSIKKAKDYGITGGNAKKNELAGYNFSLGYQQIDDQKKLTLIISGTDVNSGKVARLSLDATNGEVLTHEELQSTNAYKKNSWIKK